MSLPDYGYEPNDTIEQAWGPLQPGQEPWPGASETGYADHLADWGDVDFFWFATAGAQTVTVGLTMFEYTDESTCRAVDVEVLDERGQLAAGPDQATLEAATRLSCQRAVRRLDT